MEIVLIIAFLLLYTLLGTQVKKRLYKILPHEYEIKTISLIRG